MTGAELIAAERRRQVEVEGWSASHDDEHDDEALIWAAICYASAATYGVMLRGSSPPPDNWPWDESFWKPSRDAERNLVKAGALIAAEIDRRQREVPA